MLRAVALLATLAACGPRAAPVNAKLPEAGVSLALYAGGDTSYALVDDRRWIDVDGTRILLANIDPGAELASLVIEPADAALQIGTCARERLPDAPVEDALEAYARQQRERRAEELRRRIETRLGAPVPHVPHATADGARFLPVVTCDVVARPGRYLVRVLYVTSALGYRAQHDIDVRDDHRAQVSSRFAIATPPWRSRASAVLYDGVPGGQRTPQEIVRGYIELDGSTAVLSVPSREVPIALRRVYQGAVIIGDDSSDAMWGAESVQAVWVWLELAKLRLAPGPIRVHLELAGEGTRDLDVAQRSRVQDDTPDAALRLPLWVDESLRGMRQRVVEYNDGASLRERVMLGVTNMGETTRDVYVEEKLRTAARRRLERAWPAKPAASGDTLRTKLTVKPGVIERTGYTLVYDF